MSSAARYTGRMQPPSRLPVLPLRWYTPSTAMAQAAAKALFSGGPAAEIPALVLKDEDFEEDGIGIIALLVKAGFATSNGDARRAVTKDGSIKIDGRKVSDPFEKISKEAIGNGEIVLAKGKKKFKKLVYVGGAE